MFMYKSRAGPHLPVSLNENLPEVLADHWLSWLHGQHCRKARAWSSHPSGKWLRPSGPNLRAGLGRTLNPTMHLPNYGYSKSMLPITHMLVQQRVLGKPVSKGRGTGRHCQNPQGTWWKGHCPGALLQVLYQQVNYSFTAATTIILLMGQGLNF